VAKDLSLFLRQTLRNPAGVGAVAPSSRALARCMAKGVNADGSHVIEIGSGTGRITRAILEAGVSPEHLSLFEMNPAFCQALRSRFPGVAVHNQMAQQMTALDLNDVSTVISGLPLLNMPLPVQDEIVSSVFNTLRKGGTLVQFTYGPRPPIIDTVREKLGLSHKIRGKIWANLPPATVYVFRQTH
jgi:phosphatidylethanolamine/phosphatidyl-N-methylethanolamine N-methyltransferase